MSPNVNPLERVFAVQKLDGHFALGIQGWIKEQRTNPRIAASAFTRAEDAAYTTLRAEEIKRESTAAEDYATREEKSQALANWYNVILERAQKEESI